MLPLNQVKAHYGWFPNYLNGVLELSSHPSVIWSPYLAHDCPYYSRREGYQFVDWGGSSIGVGFFKRGKREKRELEFVPKFNDLITLIIIWTQQIHSKTENAPFLGHSNKTKRFFHIGKVFNFWSILWCSQKWESSIGRFSQIWLWMRYGS